MIGLVTLPGVRSKVIVAPAHAVLIIERKEPAPLSLLLVTIVGPQLTVIVAVAALLRPAPLLLVAPCTSKLPFEVELSAGVNFRPALPSVTETKSLLLI